TSCGGRVPSARIPSGRGNRARPVEARAYRIPLNRPARSSTVELCARLTRIEHLHGKRAEPVLPLVAAAGDERQRCLGVGVCELRQRWTAQSSCERIQAAGTRQIEAIEMDDLRVRAVGYDRRRQSRRRQERFHPTAKLARRENSRDQRRFLQRRREEVLAAGLPLQRRLPVLPEVGPRSLDDEGTELVVVDGLRVVQ